MRTASASTPTAAAASPARAGAPGGEPVVLSAAGVYKTYRLGRVDVPVLKGASLEVRRHEWVAVLGSSGSGKSTLLHLLGGLDRPDRSVQVEHCPKCKYNLKGLPAKADRCPECGTLAKYGGTVLFGDQSLREMNTRALDRYRNASVGFVFQFYHLLPELNVLENALVPAMVLHKRWGFLRRRAELHKRAQELLSAFGLGHRLRHRPAELSGGERQRVAIARALINDPPILLADEPTGNLDRKTGESILDLITRHRAQSGRTIVMVTHDSEVAARADRIVHLVDGRVAEQGL
jgi:lipoprotein-releasing system ATP-binding protein